MFEIIGLLITLFYLLYLIGNIGGQIFHWNHYTLTTTYFPHFAGGMIAANLYLKNKVPPLKVLLIFVVLSLALSMAFQHYSTLKFYTQIPISVLITSIILFTAKSFNTYSINNAITKTTEYLGKYTYGLYVYSGFVLTFFIKFYPWSDTWYKFALQCIILFVVARFSYHYFEVFFIRLKQHFQPLSPKTEKQAK